MRILLTKDLAPLRAAAEETVRIEAEAQRARFVSPGNGKAMAYAQKAAEAADYLRLVAGGETVDPADFPHVFQEASALAIPPEAMAALIMRLRRQWQAASAIIERIERAAILAVAAAPTAAAIDTASRPDWADLLTLIAESEAPS